MMIWLTQNICVIQGLYEKCQFDCPSWHVAVSMSRTLATQTSSPDTDKIMTFYTPCFTEKEECVGQAHL
jgi:hypothetical protein